jgi:hypothetical protein
MNKLRSTEALTFISQIKCDDLEDVSFVLYNKIFGELPHKAAMGHIRKEGLIDFLKKKFKIQKEDFYISYAKRLSEPQINTIDFIGVCYIEKIIFYHVDNCLVLFFPFNAAIDKIQDLFNEIEAEFTTETKEPLEINLLVSNHHNLDFEPVQITERELDLARNYNADLMDVHELVLSELNKHNHKGLILLHGKPGTGKTTYLRYLIPKITNKRIIYVGADMASRLGDPSFMKLLIGAQNSVLVIEDAEVLLLQREDNVRANAISNLLNISDGLLADFLNIQIICTFNTNLENIDKALMRKGRLIARYEFKELDTLRTNELLKQLHGQGAESATPLTISEIYNFGQNEFNLKVNKKKIGF